MFYIKICFLGGTGAEEKWFGFATQPLFSTVQYRYCLVLYTSTLLDFSLALIIHFQCIATLVWLKHLSSGKTAPERGGCAQHAAWLPRRRRRGIAGVVAETLQSPWRVSIIVWSIFGRRNRRRAWGCFHHRQLWPGGSSNGDDAE